MRIRAIKAIGMALLLGSGGCVTHPEQTGQADPIVKPVAAVKAPVQLSDSDLLASEAIQLISENKLDDASTKINLALKQRLDRSYYHLLNGLIYHLIARSANKGEADKGSYDLARQGYEMAIRFDPSNWQAQYLLGRLCIDVGDYNNAQKYLVMAVGLHRDDPKLLDSLIYASYRNNSPDVAAAAIQAMEKAGGFNGRDTTLRNAALVMSALGEREQADRYFNQLRTVSTDQHLLTHVNRRIQDWQEFYAMEPKLRTVEFSNFQGSNFNAPANPMVTPQFGGGFGNAMGGVPPKTAIGTENKMVVVDVVMILTEENMATSRGVNVLTGLKMQFGDSTNPAYSKGFSRKITDTTAATTAADATTGVVAAPSTTTGITDTRSITRALTIPAISYTLNIMNASEQRNEILARPTLVALAGESSEFFSGVDLTAAAVSQGTQGGEAVRIQKEIGVKLLISPSFIDTNHLKLNVTAQRSFLNTPSTNVDFAYKLETTLNKVTASVVMRYGETLILGGLSEKESEKASDGVPGLQDIPGLQYLFSQNIKRDFQKSVLILLTPHPPQYVYQTEHAREEYEKTLSEDERPLAALRARYADWFRPYPNWASAFHHLQNNSLYREFRTGDVALESWADMTDINERLKQIKEFLYY
ncbi:MAG: hypothetical protein HQL77_12945 [Magnetococcales bacterium]|nr:hypothetical protein [Magnetococcales bacterium]